jgi:von Willebrand factor type A domain
MPQEQAIKTSTIQFHDGQYSIDHTFGVITLEINSLPMTTSPQQIHFMNDMSGSMGSCCNDGRSKMDHLVHTKKNMLNVLAKNAETTDIVVESFAFDDVVEEVFTETKVTPDNLSELYSKTTAILQPRNQTDIGLALQHSRETVSLRARTIIFMTDGDITSGVKNQNTLMSMLDPHSSYYFVGYGEGHNATLLQTLAKGPNSKYYFVDAIENAGFVFGDILHNILYTILKNATITIENGELYDYTQKAWVTSFAIGGLVSEETKTFHIRTTGPQENVNILLQASNETSITFTKLPTGDLTKFILRQETQEMLSLVADISPYENNDIQQTMSKLTALVEKIKAYTLDTESPDIEFYQSLLTDLTIAMKTLGTSKAKMYCTARNDSQGRGDAYAPTLSSEDGYGKPPILRRDGSTPTKMKIFADMAPTPKPFPSIPEEIDTTVFAPSKPSRLARSSSMF